MGSGGAPRGPQQAAGGLGPVLILTPTGRDAAVATASLHTAGIRTQHCRDVAALCAAMDTAAAGLIADEALPALARDVLRLALQRQPVWSDFPVMLLTSSAQATEALWQWVQGLGAVGNITVLERPLTPVTLLSTIHVALRSRRRQHELQQLHAAQQRHIAAQAALLAQLQARDQALHDLNATLEQQVAARTAALAHAMAERQRLEREAQRAEHFVLLGRLAAGVSHELRNPLGAVFLHVDLLAEELASPTADSAAQTTESFSEIRKQLTRLDDVLQDYLSLVRVGAIERTPQDVGAALQEWLGEWQGLATARRVVVQAEGLATLGEVAYHASTLRRALLNLVQNALEAMPEGGTLTLTGQGTATHVQLAVQDTGSGIPAEQVAKIFEPLYTTKPGGTGLGLYLVQEIIAAHAGQVTVESVPGQGTTFRVVVPRRVATTSAPGS
jgi:signal transduction histidine kinase